MSKAHLLFFIRFPAFRSIFHSTQTTMPQVRIPAIEKNIYSLNLSDEHFFKILKKRLPAVHITDIFILTGSSICYLLIRLCESTDQLRNYNLIVNNHFHTADCLLRHKFRITSNFSKSITELRCSSDSNILF